jgi:hypothetical protein
MLRLLRTSLSSPRSDFRSWAPEPAAVVPTRSRALPARPYGRRPARRPLRRGRSNRVNNVHSVRSRAGAATAATALPRVDAASSRPAGSRPYARLPASRGKVLFRRARDLLGKDLRDETACADPDAVSYTPHAGQQFRRALGRWGRMPRALRRALRRPGEQLAPPTPPLTSRRSALGRRPDNGRVPEGRRASRRARQMGGTHERAIPRQAARCRRAQLRRSAAGEFRECHRA